METVVEVAGFGDSVVIAGEQVGKDGIWLATDVAGLVDPTVDTVTKSYGGRPGSRFVSSRVTARSVTFKVTIDNADNGWLSRDERWRKLWRFDDYTELRVTTEGSGTRVLRCRLEEIAVDTEYDPAVNQSTDVVMSVVADDPFWYGDDFVTDINVSKQTTITVREANPTGSVVYPVWVVSGGTEWTLPDYADGDGAAASRFVTLPYLSYKESAVVDTDPGARQLMTVTGSNAWGRMNGVRFRGGIPPHTGRVAFSVSATKPGQAQLRLRRPYLRPWGGV